MADVSANMARSLRLLRGGLFGAAAAGAVCAAVSAVAFGAAGCLTALAAAGVVIAFFIVGQGVVALCADADPRAVLLVSLSSYLARVVVLGYLLYFALSDRSRFGFLQPAVLLVCVVVVVVAWLACELWTYTRLRIPAFDS
ncbi:MAG: hypothetical protein LBR32_06650 [Propionibacteriaceae bacterium]|jgi:hypothetical protein|nr:hypothetical protein [Propionibacteriaceae bacterium]